MIKTTNKNKARQRRIKKERNKEMKKEKEEGTKDRI